MGIRYQPGIDGLRAIAVLAVVAYHAGLGGAGYVGVDIFFVISGYLITALLAKELESGRIDLVAFYARRARRILPALVVVVVVTLIVSAIIGLSGAVAESAAAAGAFVANLYFQAQTGGYWSTDAAGMPLLHLWSLSVEEQFYIVWPLVLLIARRKPVAALALLAACSFALATAWSPEPAAFYLMPARAWELSVGGLIALRPVRLPKWSATVGLVMVLLSCVFPVEPFPGVGALPAVLGAALVINGAEHSRVLAWKPLVYVGLISYSLYLWHWPLLAIAHESYLDEVPVGVRISLVALAFVLAALSYCFVETPFRRAGSNRRTVAVGVACLVVLTCGAFAYAKTHTKGDWSPAREACYQPFGSEPEFRCTKGEIVLWGDSMALAWEPFVREMGSVALYSRGACAQVGTSREYARCERFNSVAFQAARKAKVVVLASAWQPAHLDDLDAVLAALPGRVYIIGPTPTMPHDATKCLRLGEPCNGSVDSAARERIRAIAAKHGATLIDPVPFLCPKDCPAYINGRALYWDEKHVAASTAREFSRWRRASQAAGGSAR